LQRLVPVILSAAKNLRATRDSSLRSEWQAPGSEWQAPGLVPGKNLTPARLTGSPRARCCIRHDHIPVRTSENKSCKM